MIIQHHRSRLRLSSLPTAFVALFSAVVSAIGCFPSETFGVQPIDELKAGVVKVLSNLEGNPKMGTGIIIHREGDTAYILTASHVTHGDQKPKMFFFTDPNRTFPARMIGQQDNGTAKDLSVWAVEGNLPANISVLALDTQTTFEEGKRPRSSDSRAWPEHPGPSVKRPSRDRKEWI